MDKILLACFVELVLGVMGLYLIPPLWLGPYLIGVTACVGVGVLWVHRDAIRRWLDGPRRRTYRDYQEHLKQAERQKWERLAEERRVIEANPGLGDPQIDFEKRQISAPGRPFSVLQIRLGKTTWYVVRPWRIYRKR